VKRLKCKLIKFLKLGIPKNVLIERELPQQQNPINEKFSSL